MNYLLATKVMGWHIVERYYESDGTNFIWWYNKDNEVMLKEKWHPDTNLNQAMACADKLIDGQRYIKYSAEKWIGGTGIECAMYFIGLDGKWIGGIVKDTLQLAICEAILEAVK